MTVLIYPAELPQLFLVEGYSASPADLDLASQTDIGPARVRRQQTAGVAPLTVVTSLNDWQKERLKRFYRDDARGRTNPWRVPEPGVDGQPLLDADGVTVLTDEDGQPLLMTSLLLVRFVHPPQIVRAAWPSLSWRSTMQLEVLP